VRGQHAGRAGDTKAVGQELQRAQAHHASLIAGDNDGLDLWIALNDRIADGRDVSWVWDADFELLAGAVRRVTCSGTRAPEMALRLKYAGWPVERIVVEPGIEASLDRAVADTPEQLFALPTYTALLELHKVLSGRGLTQEFWR
jgi:UDP-N-acetylmuramyl tripeptide synthase